VLGLLNWRNRVLWVIDLAQMLKLQPRYHCPTVPYSNYPSRASSLGLVVQEVKGITQFTPDCLQFQLLDQV